MVLQEVAYHTVINGVYPKLAQSKRKAWPKFPLNLGSLILHTSTHATILGKEIASMNLGKAPKMMHDPKAYMASLFMHENARFQYVHEDEPDESIYMEAIEFHEALSKIVDPNIKAHVFKYQRISRIPFSILDR